MTDDAKTYINKPVRVLAIQWNGDNLRLIQDFLWPASPYYQPAVLGATALVDKPEVMRVPIRDLVADQQYPALAPNLKDADVPRGAWLVRYHYGARGVQVLSVEEFEAMFEPELSVCKREDAKAGRPVVLVRVERQPAAHDDGSTIDRE